MIQSFSRCIEILIIVADSPDGIKLADIARITKLKYTPVYNLVSSMMKEGMIRRGEGHVLFLGPMVTDLHNRRRHGELIRHARSIMLSLIRRYPETNLTYSRFTGTQITAFLNRSQELMGEIRAAKSVLPPYQTVAGLVFLAFLPEEDAMILRGNFPFTERNLAEWGTEKALDDAVRLCRERQYARLPFDPPEMSRIGIPLFHKGRLSGALTCTCLNLTAKEEKGLLNELLKLTGVVLEEPSVENLFLRA